MPDAVVDQVGYIVAFVVVSSVIAVFVAFVAVDAVVALPESAPVNVVAVTLPVLGLNVKFVLETF